MTPDDIGTILRALGKLEGRFDSVDDKVDDIKDAVAHRVDDHEARIRKLETRGRLSWWDVLKLVTGLLSVVLMTLASIAAYQGLVT